MSNDNLSIDKIVLDAQLKQNKVKLDNLPNNPELSQDVQKALIAIGDIVNGNSGIAVSKIEQGQGDFSGYVDMEFTSKDGVSAVSLNNTEWKVKGIDDIQYNGHISDYKELNKTFDSSIIDYKRIEQELGLAQPIPTLDKEVSLIQDNYVANLERMGALEDFKQSGVNLPVESLEQIKNFAEKNNYSIGEFEKESGTNTVKFDILDSNSPVMTLAIQESGKVELSQGGSTYEITANAGDINSRLDSLNNNYSLEKNPVPKGYEEVLNDASQNWHKNDLVDFKDISNSLVAEHGAKVLGNYDVSNMEINLTFHNANEQPLFEMHSTKQGRDIDVVGLHSNEEFSYSKSDPMTVDLIKQQYSVEAMEIDRKLLDITSQKDAIEVALDKNFSNENLEKYESLQSQHDVLSQSNSIEYSPEPEQTYNVNLNYTVPSQSQTNDVPVETPISTEQTVTETPSMRNDQNAAIPEQMQHVEPSLTDTTSTTSKTEIEQQPVVANQDKGATLDKVGYEVPQSVSSDFVHTPSDSSFKPSKFYEKSNPVAVAFEDRGKSLSSSRDDNKTIGAMVAVAKSKNWNEIQVKGTEDFKRKAWLEAASQGIKVKGFKPTERDLAALEAKQEEMSRNQIHHVPQREQTAQTQVKTSQEVKTNHNPNFKEHEQAKIITARRILEDSLNKQNKSPSEIEKALKGFDQMTKHPENVQKLVAAQTKQTKEIEHQKTASQERSR